ncbi:hypothetical protein [Vibrio pelagius]|uniref:hypothetical protein n=1 Tax=Vibrio pelagius TaxID=28169 RepID=UPI0021C39F64|nr:hypothetical protein [Vibrio pelagius]
MRYTAPLTLAFFSLFLSFNINAAAFGVAVAWKTDDAQAVFDTMPIQKKAFSNLIDAGLIHDMFVSKSNIGDKSFPIIKFVMEANSEQEVRDTIGNLPLQYKELAEVVEVRDIGNKWLNSDVAFVNYAVELSWKKPEDKLLVDKVISRDLQKIVDWSATSTITSAYLYNKDISGSSGGDSKMVRPVYSIAVLAKDEDHARQVASELEAVKLGFADVHVSELGFKLTL